MAIVSVNSTVLFLSALLKSIGPPIDPFFSDQPSIKVVIIKLLWLDSGPSLLILLCFLFSLWFIRVKMVGVVFTTEQPKGSVCPSEVFEKCALANTG